MKAQELISEIKAEVGENLIAIKDTLEDGEALLSMGITDDDQESVEEAHYIISELIRASR